jgi:hypothetical protein
MVNDQELERLDRLEGHPNYYKREKMSISLRDPNIIKVEAWIYIHPNPRGEENPTGNWDPDNVWPGGDREQNTSLKKRKFEVIKSPPNCLL